MCAAESGISLGEWLDLPLSSAVALLRAVEDKIARADAMHASIARMIYVCLGGARRRPRLSEFTLFYKPEV